MADRVYKYTIAYFEENLHSKVEMGRPKIEWLHGSWDIKGVSIRPDFGRESKELVTRQFNNEVQHFGKQKGECYPK